MKRSPEQYVFKAQGGPTPEGKSKFWHNVKKYGLIAGGIAIVFAAL